MLAGNNTTVTLWSPLFRQIDTDCCVVLIPWRVGFWFSWLNFEETQFNYCWIWNVRFWCMNFRMNLKLLIEGLCFQKWSLGPTNVAWQGSGGTVDSTGPYNWYMEGRIWAKRKKIGNSGLNLGLIFFQMWSNSICLPFHILYFVFCSDFQNNTWKK